MKTLIQRILLNSECQQYLKFFPSSSLIKQSLEHYPLPDINVFTTLTKRTRQLQDSPRERANEDAASGESRPERILYVGL